MEVDVVLLHRFSAIVDLFVFLIVFGCKFPACKGSYRFFICQDTIRMVSFVNVMGIFLLNKLLLGSVFTSSHGRPPVNGNIPCLRYLQDMGIQLTCPPSHS